ncbi:class I SAM-dependent methyltransferase [Streptomyces sp. NPDC048527]|uniref:class I SAM-dependent methyltransferase n=1 Tax=Streptomyces sp. NPDC048527 TaxID=3365568 RepID=UPI00371945AD
MTEDQSYDTGVAQTYGESENIPIRRYAEFPTFFNALGPIDGAHVLDLACGTGTYSRLLVRQGAADAVGVDASADMIDHARAQTTAQAIRYRVADVLAVPHLGEFDVVSGSFLLNYSQHRGQLDRMCQTIARHLRPGGRFAGVLPNPDYDYLRPLDRNYVASFGCPEGLTLGEPVPRDGAAFRFTLDLTTPLSIVQYYWSAKSYREALEGAGLRDVRLVPSAASEKGIEKFGEVYWKTWDNNPMYVVVLATRPA